VLALAGAGLVLVSLLLPPFDVVATGLTAPRRLAVHPDGSVIVSEAGTGQGDGRIVQIRDRQIVPLVERLPSWTYTPTEIVGPSGVVIVRGEIRWAQGLGRQPLLSSTLMRRNGSAGVPYAGFSLLAAGAPDGETSVSNPFDLIVEDDGTTYVSDASANVIWRVPIDGPVAIHTEWTAIDDPVPTGLARRGPSDYYAALFSPAPHAADSGAIVRFDAAGQRSVAVANLTLPIAIAFDRDGAMLVLEFAGGFEDGHPIGFQAASGRILRIADGERRAIATGLDYPTDMKVGPDGEIYVTARGAFGAGGGGSVLRLRSPGRIGWRG
jgi:sugar lactone lactonase YvrE